jgi:hypothetical protein
MSAADLPYPWSDGPSLDQTGRDSEAGETAQAPVITPTSGQCDLSPLRNTLRLAEFLARAGIDPKPGTRWGTFLLDWGSTIPAGDGASLLPVGSVPTYAGLAEGSTSTDEAATRAEPTLTGPSENTPAVGHSATEPRPDAALDGADGRGDTGVGPTIEEDLARLEGRVAAHVETKDHEGFLDDVDLHQALAELQIHRRPEFIRICNSLHELISSKDLQGLLTSYRGRLGADQAGRPGATPAAPEVEERGILYSEEGGWTSSVYTNPRNGATTRTDLAGFVAHLEEMVHRDDGLESHLGFRITGTRADGRILRTLDLSAIEFDAMAWPLTRWGLHVEAVPHAKDHLKAAILKSSVDCPTRTVYTHSGWREVGGHWLYLHAGGAIGPDGTDPDVQVELPDRLALYHLPEPPEGEALHAAIRAVLGLLDLGSPARPGSQAVAAVALVLPFRVVLGRTLFNGWIEGLSGAFKTELAANVLQRFFGSGFHREAAPGSWSSTDNALENQAHAAKDALFLIDDYRPPEGLDRQRYAAKASRLLRNAVDRRGRDRARINGSLQSSKYPRGALLVTAEAGPPAGDQAAIGRTLILKVAADRPEDGLVGTFDRAILRRCADDAATGLYASALAAFLRSVAPRYDEVRAGLRKRVNDRAQTLRSFARVICTPEA